MKAKLVTVGTVFLATVAEVLIIADGILVHDVMVAFINRKAQKKAEKEAAKQAKKAA